MPAAMTGRTVISVAVLALALAGGACGSEIGDACTIHADCQESDPLRKCDNFSPGGYCTIEGCDFDTCPGEAVCIRFFTGSFTNRTCDPVTEDEPGGLDECSLDELCALEGHCVPRSAEIRACMRKCNGSGDCRAEYECRDLELMRLHGGEPVSAPGAPVDLDPQAFCAPAPQAI
jgi:hypothetical protein